LDAGAVIADVQDCYFNKIANAAIRIADQKIKRFHQFEKIAPSDGMDGACPASAGCLCKSRCFANWKKLENAVQNWRRTTGSETEVSEEGTVVGNQVAEHRNER
jgi:hypothetical protein